MKDYKTSGYSFLWQVLIAIAITIIPFILYTHLLFDENRSYVYIFGYKYDHELESNSVAAWIVFLRLIPVSLFTIWFLECTYWWRWFILIQIVFWFDSFIQQSIYFHEFLENNLFLFSVFSNICLITLILFLKKSLGGFMSRMPLVSTRLVSITLNPSILNIYKRILFRLNSIETDKQLLLRQLVLYEKVISKDSRLVSARNSTKIFDIIIVCVLCTMPLLFYSHEFVPLKENYTLLGINFSSNGFSDVRTHFWYLNTKICLIIPLIIWILTSSNWWRHSILSPILFTFYQIWENFNSNDNAIDEKSMIYSLPFMLLLIFVIILLTQRVKYANRIEEMVGFVKNEINHILSNT